MNSPFNNSYWLEPGRILCGEYPRDFDDLEDHEGMSAILDAGLWVNAQHGDYAAAVLHAVNLGEDTDTTGCVAGALAGILHGIAGIPAEWREKLVKADMLELAATEFAGFAPRKK
jgi:hypothetical protein